MPMSWRNSDNLGPDTAARLRQHVRAAERRARLESYRARWRMVRATPAARPSIFGIPPAVTEALLFAVRAAAIILAITILILDEERKHPLLDGHERIARLLFYFALTVLFIVFMDLWTYKPLIYTVAGGMAYRLSENLELLSKDFKLIINEFEQTPSSTLAELAAMEDNLKAALDEFLLIDVLRRLVVFRVVSRLFAMLVSLTLLGYAMTYSVGAPFVSSDGKTHTATFTQHLYYTLVMFFTIGFGDLSPKHAWTGYLYTCITVFVLAAISYFVLTDLVSSQSEFRSDIRAMARNIVERASIWAATPSSLPAGWPGTALGNPSESSVP